MHAVLRKISRNITVCYGEIFPDDENSYLHFAYNGKLFLIADSYCLNPDCTCREAVLNFVQVYPRRSEKETDSFMVRTKLNGRGYKIHERNRFSKFEIKAIMVDYTDDGTLLSLLNARYKEMKEKVNEILG
ncbi:hypothetical protein A8F94_18630 [Bacillus sp. FJAT-27225]|uniref:hypothetical protein n=1 Tax=Bacillus sp. FJAT-27225 TaxID=1743144 RepID=UPI00080C2F31|nr:hypothetical protein [Bacillus sp. FJAT-27225]OCA83142.1 hypothetical protein A8F94_18630 [Bacillus sp. FJAT-27225]